MVISSFWFYNREYKRYTPSIRLFEISTAKDILSLGSKFFFVQIAAIFIYQTTNIIIAQVATPQDVTIYNIAYKYFGIATMISGIVFAPFWSAFTDAFVKQDYEWMHNIYSKLSKFVTILSLFVIILLIPSSVVYKIWIGDVIYIPFKISLTIAGFVISNIFAGLYSQILNGTGKIKLQFIVSNIAMLLNVPLALILGKILGVSGVILPSLFLNIIGVIIYSTQVKLILKKKSIGIWNQ
jgi:O-antigen/teichoic acid export membrane protein